MGSSNSKQVAENLHVNNWQSINYNSITVEGITDENILYDENGQKKDRRLKVERELLKAHPFRCIGLLKYIDQHGESGIGTAFLISKNLVLTTAHSIYYKHPIKNDLRYATNIFFYPAIRGSVDNSQPFKVCKFKFHKNFQQLVKKIIFSKTQAERKSLKIQTQRYDCALLRLEKSIELDQYINIIYNYHKNDENQEVSVFGYPYEPTKHINGIYNFKQYGHSSKSFYIQEKGNIFYRIDTSGGQSGSPILIKEKNGKYSVIGIHKGYAGNNYNLGFLLKSQAMLWIYQWQMEIRFQLKKTFTAKCFSNQIQDNRCQWKKLLESYIKNKQFENKQIGIQQPVPVQRPNDNINPVSQNVNPEKKTRTNNFFPGKLQTIHQQNQQAGKKNLLRRYCSTQNIYKKSKCREYSQQIFQKQFTFQFSKDNQYSKNIFEIINYQKKIKIKKIAKDQKNKFIDMNQIVSKKKLRVQRINLITAKIIKYGSQFSKICFGILTEGRVSQKSSGDIDQKQSIGYWSYAKGSGAIIIDGILVEQNKKRHLGVNQLIQFNINCIDGKISWTNKFQKIQRKFPQSLLKIKQKLYFFVALKQINDTIQILFD